MGSIIKTPGLTEQVTDYLKSQILEGRWVPGNKIDSENKLTQELGISRASVRSGIKQLEAIGILECRQGKGTFVRAIPAKNISQKLNQLYQENKDMHDLLEYRMIVESESCRLAAERMTEYDLSELENIYNRMIAEYLKKEKRSSNTFAETDFGFHKCIYRATGNTLILESLKRISAETEKYQRQFNTDYLSERAVHYHGEILKAFRERDGERASDQMRKHLSLVIKEYDKLLKETENI